MIKKLFVSLVVLCLVTFSAMAGNYEDEWSSNSSILTPIYGLSVPSLTVSGSFSAPGVVMYGAGGDIYGVAQLALRTSANGNSYFLQYGGKYMEFDLGPNNNTNTLMQINCAQPNCIVNFPDAASDWVVFQDKEQTLNNKHIAYTPGDASKWASPAPANVQDALDRMAALLNTLNGAPIP